MVVKSLTLKDAEKFHRQPSRYEFEIEMNREKIPKKLQAHEGHQYWVI